MIKLPISLCLFTSTKGHYGSSTYGATLRHLNRQIPLSSFGALYAHVKVGTQDALHGEGIENDLSVQGFHVDKTVGDWQRGTSHQQGYLADQNRASQSLILQSQPYMLLVEDDSVMISHKGDLLARLGEMVDLLQRDPNLVSTRFVRRADFDGGLPILKQERDAFFSPNYDLQPSILRSRDFMLAHKLIEANWAQLGHLQCELVLRIALDTLSRSEHRHLVWMPDVAETIHLGVPDYPALKQSLNL